MYITAATHEQRFNSKPAQFTVPVAPTREFWMHVLATKIEVTVDNPGDMIGREDDEETVGPVASSAKLSLDGSALGLVTGQMRFCQVKQVKTDES